MSEQCCGTCKWYPIEKLKDKSGRILKKDRVALCQFPKPKLPIAVFRSELATQYSYTQYGDGIECPCYERRPG